MRRSHRLHKCNEDYIQLSICRGLCNEPKHPCVSRGLSRPRSWHMLQSRRHEVRLWVYSKAGCARSFEGFMESPPLGGRHEQKRSKRSASEHLPSATCFCKESIHGRWPLLPPSPVHQCRMMSSVVQQVCLQDKILLPIFRAALNLKPKFPHSRLLAPRATRSGWSYPSCKGQAITITLTKNSTYSCY